MKEIVEKKCFVASDGSIFHAPERAVEHEARLCLQELLKGICATDEQLTATVSRLITSKGIIAMAQVSKALQAVYPELVEYEATPTSEWFNMGSWPTDPKALIIVRNIDGQQMYFTAEAAKRAMSETTPEHLRFIPVKWKYDQ